MARVPRMTREVLDCSKEETILSTGGIATEAKEFEMGFSKD